MTQKRGFSQRFSGGFPTVFSASSTAVFWRFSDGFASGFPPVFQRDLLFSQAAGNGFTARCLPSMDRERPKPPADTSMTPLERVGAPTVVRYDAVPISNGLTAEPVGSVRPVRAVGGVVQGHQGGPGRSARSSALEPAPCRPRLQA